MLPFEWDKLFLDQLPMEGVCQKAGSVMLQVGKNSCNRTCVSVFLVATSPWTRDINTAVNSWGWTSSLPLTSPISIFTMVYPASLSLLPEASHQIKVQDVPSTSSQELLIVPCGVCYLLLKMVPWGNRTPSLILTEWI